MNQVPGVAGWLNEVSDMLVKVLLLLYYSQSLR